MTKNEKNALLTISLALLCISTYKMIEWQYKNPTNLEKIFDVLTCTLGILLSSIALTYHWKMFDKNTNSGIEEDKKNKLEI